MNLGLMGAEGNVGASETLALRGKDACYSSPFPVLIHTLPAALHTQVPGATAPRTLAATAAGNHADARQCVELNDFSVT